MIKRNKGKCIASSLVIVLPAILALIFWDKLPETTATHFNAAGQADGFGTKAIFLILPLILLALHWLCLLITARDPKNQDQGKKAFSMIFYILPALSWVCSAVIYGASTGMSLDVARLMPLLIGAMFIFMGNLLPKVKQNSTLGVKVKWALANEENWNATHRFSGKVWVIAGFVIALSAFLPDSWVIWVLLPVLAFAAALPVIFSYAYYKKQVAAGTAPKKAEIPATKWNKGLRIFSVVIILIVLCLLVVLMCTGDVTVTYNEDSFTLNATYWQSITVPYDSIDEMGIRQWEAGMKANGFNSARLNLGVFQNEQVGAYTSYAYAWSEKCVVILSQGDFLVISGVDDSATQAIYEAISERR